jgi:RNA polymerase sigma-70 factor (ECF subfamily)
MPLAATARNSAKGNVNTLIKSSLMLPCYQVRHGGATCRLHFFIASSAFIKNATVPLPGRSYVRGGLLSAGDDQADVERVLAGDADAFESIVRRWHHPLISLAYRFCRDHGRAEEMAQEAFLRAYRALHQWRKDAVFSTWLFALATNVYRSELRRIPVKMVSIEEASEVRDLGPNDGGFEDEDRNRVVRELVLTLPAKYRDAVILFYFHGMDISAAAHTLRLPEGTLKTRLSRARELLRSKLPHVLIAQQVKES